MNTALFYFFAAAFVLCLVYVCFASVAYGARYAARNYWRFRGRRVVVCPETRRPVAVEVDAGHAAVTAFMGGRELVLDSCTRWPERAGCDQACVFQIERAPEDCLVRNMLNDFYRERACAFCGRVVGEVRLADHRPAFLSPDGLIIEWAEVPAERLPEVFGTHRAVCWNCQVAETFRREHPELVTDRRPHAQHYQV
jgi:hypothetical protein